MTTIVDIPAEVLDDILHLVVFEVVLRWHDLWRLRLNLVTVCSTFKNIIYGAPRYWSRLVVHRYTRRGYLEFCLRRTGSAHVFLWIDSQQAPNHSVYNRTIARPPFPQFIGSLRLHLRPSFHRVVSLQVKGGVEEDYLATIAELKQYDASSLSRLYLQFDKRYRTLAADYAAFGSLQRLSFLVFHCTVAVAPHASYAGETLTTETSVQSRRFGDSLGADE
ncbi:hypothetical protein B0H15DRAFT_955337 [Mycena belliarum]|uniref:F-box domain-containing protein n=1 Tax=Mycena belliarum TaxID=1033014 RepID=A0AAD6TWL3_9AGAR|nr:hypothetical protein B0H15DRAFT_955337 [Mycena belliae]